MRQVLLLFVSLVSAFALHAQTVLVKDSTVDSDDGKYYYYEALWKYQHNDSCQITRGKSDNDRFSLFYNAEGLIYQRLSKSYDDAKGGFINSFRDTYTYTASKKMNNHLTEQWNQYGHYWFNRAVIGFRYDENDHLVRLIYQSWHGYDSKFDTHYETYFYNDKFGRVDSAITKTWGQTDSSIYYYTYYGTTTNIQRLINVSSSDRNHIIFRSNFFYDSSDYVRTDSVVSREPDAVTDSLKLTNIGVTRHFYHRDGSIKELDREYLYIPYSDKSFQKTFYTYERCSSGLPLALHADRQNNNALLNWQTEDGGEASGFTLQRSTDGEHFTSINNVSASANNVNENYTYTDANALLLKVPKLYYRLAKTSEDGAVTYSKIAILNVAASNVMVTLSPNPVANILHLYSAENIGVASVTVTDMKGRMVCSASANMMAGGQTNINVSALAKGLYIVTLQTANLKQQFKVIKE